MSADREEHTPGPWRANRSTVSPYSFIRGVNRYLVASVHYGDDPAAGVQVSKEEEHRANARLIAAAPEQNEALSLLVRTILDAERHGWSEAECGAILQVVREQAQPALAKARGEN